MIRTIAVVKMKYVATLGKQTEFVFEEADGTEVVVVAPSSAMHTFRDGLKRS